MRNRMAVVPVILSLLLWGCAGTTQETVATEKGETEAAAVFVTETVPETTDTPEPLHSELYHPNYSQEQIRMYFEEVVLDVEYTDGTGDTTLVQKWLSPIGFRIYGEPTEEDLAVLNDLVAQLNQIPGFPGFYTAEAEGQEQLRISFLDPETFRSSYSSVVGGEEAYGATQFWYYTDTNEIHSARIGCRTDIAQEERDSVLVEEIINTLGITDTVLREDSITYQYSNENTALSHVDQILLNLLYHPDMQCGMDAERCAAVIQALYY